MGLFLFFKNKYSRADFFVLFDTFDTFYFERKIIVQAVVTA